MANELTTQESQEWALLTFDVVKRFYKKTRLATNGCLEWTASLQGTLGHPYFCFAGRGWYGHRFAWTIERGTIADRLCVCHKCDNPLCVNVNHLFLGTHTDNMRDMAKKGRCKPPMLRGMQKKSAKLTDAQVKEIRALAHLPDSALAREFKVSASLICLIQGRKRWRHI